MTSEAKKFTPERGEGGYSRVKVMELIKRGQNQYPK